ncbi:protein IMPACT isoform X2 [Ascaphus truei]|uniref:protein IMPACT isoform X2 n=1 Tax=Ascaphus truei TaxID=8439 RepID=UPI003F5999FB
MADTEEENLQKQIDEIEALASIYGDEWCVIDEAARIFCITISDSSDRLKWTLCLQVILPPEYPTAAPPIYQLNAPWLRGQDRMVLSRSLEEIYLHNLGENILYQWVEKIRDVLTEKSLTSDPDTCLKNTTEEIDEDDDGELTSEYESLKESYTNALHLAICDSSEDEELPPIMHGEPITDRRSSFQAHLSPVVSPKQVKLVLNKLYENKKIATATHNIYAYRIHCEDRQTFLQDCEDDGETAAGGRLLHLMQILDVNNVMVVVSRWYGGILLGPDRFKHINNCARNILVEHNYTSSVEESAKQSGKNKRVRKESKKKTEH